MKRVIYVMLAMMMLAGCATVKNHQQTCAERYTYFPNMVTCLTSSMNWDFQYHMGRKSELAQLYLAYANKLADQVVHNQITNAQAYQALGQLYTELNTVDNFHPSIYTVP